MLVFTCDSDDVSRSSPRSGQIPQGPARSEYGTRRELISFPGVSLHDGREQPWLLARRRPGGGNNDYVIRAAKVHQIFISGNQQDRYHGNINRGGENLGRRPCWIDIPGL